MGSFYYLAYATSAQTFPDARALWSVVALVVLGSLLVHGTSAGPVMAILDRRRRLRRVRQPRRLRGVRPATTAE